MVGKRAIKTLHSRKGSLQVNSNSMFNTPQMLLSKYISPLMFDYKPRQHYLFKFSSPRTKFKESVVILLKSISNIGIQVSSVMKVWVYALGSS